MKAFWRKEPLTDIEADFLSLVLAAHGASVFRDNPSTTAVHLAAKHSDDLSKAIASGLLMMGGKHGPVQKTFDLLSSENPEAQADFLLSAGGKVPGWGSSYQKDGAQDELWIGVDGALAEHFPKVHGIVQEISRVVQNHGRNIFPNPSCYTAAAALALGMTAEIAPLIFIMGRLPSWADVFFNVRKEAE